MKFLLLDAQLPWRLAQLLRQHGQDVLHTSELSLGNRTPDKEITLLADKQDRVVVTKDADFADSFVLLGKPRRLAIVTTGNISNAELVAFFESNLDAILRTLEQHRFVEIGRAGIAVHE